MPSLNEVLTGAPDPSVDDVVSEAYCARIQIRFQELDSWYEDAQARYAERHPVDPDWDPGEPPF
jgi:hypothetical protein